MILNDEIVVWGVCFIGKGVGRGLVDDFGRINQNIELSDFRVFVLEWSTSLLNWIGVAEGLGHLGFQFQNC